MTLYNIGMNKNEEETYLNSQKMLINVNLSSWERELHLDIISRIENKYFQLSEKLSKLSSYMFLKNKGLI